MARVAQVVASFVMGMIVVAYFVKQTFVTAESVELKLHFVVEVQKVHCCP